MAYEVIGLLKWGHHLMSYFCKMKQCFILLLYKADLDVCPALHEI